MPTVLVADDSAFDRQLVGGILAEDSSLTVEFVEDGRAALQRLREGGIDLVVTDLQMPEINGLQLVTTMRVDYPHVPVILMTAMGSEVIAMDALEQGAASYVPKRKLNEWLLDTVQDVLGLSQSERAYGELIACFDSAQFSMSLKNDVSLLDPLIDYLQQIIAGMEMCDATGGYQIGSALREAISNAMVRGNLEISREQMEDERERLMLGQPSLVDQRRAELPYSERRVQVDFQVTGIEVRCQIRDEGPGFDVEALCADPDPNQAFEPSRGRGQVLMRTFMDEVTYNESGNEVTLVKRSA